MNKAIVLTSGGVGSLVAASAAREQYDVALLHVQWGHRSAERERSCFENICAALKVEQSKTVECPGFQTLAGSARVSRRAALEEAAQLTAESPPPPSFTPGLLPSLLSLAATWAGNIGAKRIILGIVENDATSTLPISHFYPDYRREFIQSFNLMIQYAKPREQELLVEAPLLELTRAEVIKLGDVMGVPFEQTWSCHAGSAEPCGRCLGCRIRTRGFLKAGVPDPLLAAVPA